MSLPALVLDMPWAPLALLAPLLMAAVCVVAGPGRASRLAVPGALLTLAAVTGVVLRVLWHGPFRHAVGGWGAPLGIDFEVDGLSALMLAMTALVASVITLYARAYFRGDEGATARAHFWPLWFFLWGGLHALFLTADVFNFYVTLEVVSLSAVALVALSGTPTGVIASLRYLMTALLGSLFYLLGIGLLYAQYGVLDLELLREVVTVNPVTQAAYVCIVTGLLIKTALVPLHVWLPPAHSSAPAPVSAALSALVIKGSFYILLRFHFDVLPRELVEQPSVWLGALGMIAVLWGSIQALRQPRLKLIVAYSTVAQVGYLFLLFPLCFASSAPGDDWMTKAWSGGVYHALSHAFAKASLFLAAGAVLHAAGGDSLRHLRGLGERRPVIATALALASVSIMGLPPSGGFVGKWLLLVAALHAGQWWWVAGILMGGLLAAAYSFRFLRELFRPAAPDQVWHDEPRALGHAALALALFALLLGFAAILPFKLLAVGAPFPANAFLEAL